MRPATGRPGGFSDRSGPTTRIGTAPDPILLRVVVLRRQHRAAVQARDTLDLIIGKCIEFAPSMDLLLRRDRAEQAVTVAEDRLAKAIRAAQNKLIPSVPEVI